MMDAEESFFEEAREPEEPEEDLEDWELGIKSGPKWTESVKVAKGLLLVWMLLAGFVGWRIATLPPDAESQDDAAETAAAQAPNGLRLVFSGKTQEATAVLEAALAEDPKQAESLAGRALVAFSSEDWKTSQDYFRRLLEVRPQAHRTEWFLSIAALALGDREAAKKHGEQFLETSPEGNVADALREALGP
jgi:tetratricopeptide (TPR) repeat protein